jgi:hypothetical protein
MKSPRVFYALIHRAHANHAQRTPRESLSAGFISFSLSESRPSRRRPQNSFHDARRHRRGLAPVGRPVTVLTRNHIPGEHNRNSPDSQNNDKTESQRTVHLVNGEQVKGLGHAQLRMPAPPLCLN